MKINNYWKAPVKKRHNKTYRKVLTKHNKRLRDKRILMYMLAWFVFTATYAFIDISNNFVISNDGVVTASIGTVPIVAPEQVESEMALPEQVISAVMIETEKSNEMQIREIACEFGFKWTDWLIRLAKCESDLNEKISNDKGNTPAGSIDRGIFQINDYWHSEVSNECAYDLRCSTIWTMQRVNAGYQSEWVCNNKI